jgi:hypothetical protein
MVRERHIPSACDAAVTMVQTSLVSQRSDGILVMTAFGLVGMAAAVDQWRRTDLGLTTLLIALGALFATTIALWFSGVADRPMGVVGVAAVPVVLVALAVPKGGLIIVLSLLAGVCFAVALHKLRPASRRKNDETADLPDL